jgi:hypothetical protein
MQKQMWIVCLAAASVGLGGFSAYAGTPDAQHRSALSFKSVSCDDDDKPEQKGKSARDDEDKPDQKRKHHEERDEEKGEHKGKPGKGDEPDHKGKHEKDDDEKDDKEDKDHGKHHEKAVSQETVERLLVQIDEVREELDKLEKQVIELKGEDEDHRKGEKDDEDRGPKHHRHHDQEDKD